MDPFLLTYQVGQESRLYDISSGLQPLSIRDQMFRGHMVVQRALADGLIYAGQPNPVLIIGAGVAGAVAALTAVENRVKTVLVEAEVPFVRQIQCRSRFVCPTQYDWPAPHWTKSKYPWTGRPLPLVWNSNSARAVVQAWGSRLKLEEINNPGLLKVRSGLRFLRSVVAADGQSVEAYFDPPLRDEPLRCSLVVSSAGMGEEKHWVPDQDPTYVGYAFWALDEFEKPDLGLAGKKANVLISGSGDGALQDFLRITTRHKAAGLIYNKAVVKAIDEEHRVAVEKEIYVAEDYAQRAAVWSRVGELDHPIQKRLHDTHQSLVDKLSGEAKLWRKIEKALDGFDGNLDRKLRIKLAYPCDHFSTCYPLNRFLVLLVARYIHKKFGYDPLLPRTKVLEAHGVGSHRCLMTPPLCHGEPHEVQYAEAYCRDFLSVGKSPSERKVLDGGPYNVVIIRHGIQKKEPPLGGKPAAAPPRQFIPYYIPWE